MKTAYLALGSNLGDRRAHLRAAVEQLKGLEHTEVMQLSRVYETEPVGITQQPRFLNMALQLRTRLVPEELLRRCLDIETQRGRVRRERWGPRTLDIDLLWFEQATRATPELTLPHPRLHERAFVVVPLADIAPELRIKERSVREWRTALGPADLVCLGNLFDPSAEADAS